MGKDEGGQKGPPRKRSSLRRPGAVAEGRQSSHFIANDRSQQTSARNREGIESMRSVSLLSSADESHGPDIHRSHRAIPPVPPPSSLSRSASTRAAKKRNLRTCLFLQRLRPRSVDSTRRLHQLEYPNVKAATKRPTRGLMSAVASCTYGEHGSRYTIRKKTTTAIHRR